MKRILHIIDNFGQGAGAEHVLLGILNNLEGYDNYLLYLNKPDDQIEQLTSKVNINYYPVTSKLSLLSASIYLRKFVKNNNIDIIHAHLTQSIIITQFARIKRIPVFITYHAILFPKFNYKSILALPYLAHLISYKKNQISIGVSNVVLAELNKRYGIKKNLHCVYNFIDEKFIQQSKLPPKEKTVFKIICIGNIRPEKNFDLLFDAFDREFKHSTNIELHIWGVNRMPINYQEQLKSRGINNLFIKGRALNIIELIPQYDLFISTSKYESFGLAVLESMACNVPVLISDIPAFKELYGGYATFFRSGSVEDFITQLKKVQADPEALNKISELAFFYAKKFSVQNTVADLQKLYQEYCGFYKV